MSAATVATTRTGTSGLAFGFALARTDRSLVEDIDRLRFDSLWVGGHVAATSSAQETVVALARLSALAETPTLGTAVLLLPVIAPALVAKQLALLDDLTDGRIVLGIGVGGEHPVDFSATGVPLAERGPRTDEAIPLLRRLWTEVGVHHPGPFFPMDDVTIVPPPRQRGGPPIVVAGRQPVAMRRAARLADGWMPYLYSPRRYAASVEVITAAAAALGRDLAGFRWMLYSPVIITPEGDEAEALELAYRHVTIAYGDATAVKATSLVLAGSASQVATRLGEYHAAGVRHVVLLPSALQDAAEVARRLADEVRPLFAAGPSSVN